MAVDAVVSRELKSLQEELSASQRERLAAPAAASSATAAAGEPVGQRPAGSSTFGELVLLCRGFFGCAAFHATSNQPVVGHVIDLLDQWRSGARGLRGAWIVRG
jgi:hypothetical protein